MKVGRQPPPKNHKARRRDPAAAELYVAVRGADVERVAAEAQTIAAANARLAEGHRARRQELSTE